MTQQYGLAGKIALVTGVSRLAGVGAAVATRLATHGANIVTTYFRPYDPSIGFADCEEDAQSVLDSIQLMGVRAVGIEADLSDVSSAGTIFDFAEREIGPVDILINNATVDYSPTDIYTLTPDLLDQHYAVNMRGTLLLCSEFARRYQGESGGRIINLSSGQGLHPMPDNLPYAMTKAAIECMTGCLSVTLRSKNITVNAVDPGATQTGWMSEELVDNLRRTCLYSRVGDPLDAARMIAFLASTEAQWITGQILHSRGGA